MNLTKAIKHIFRSTGTTAFSPKEVHKKIPKANGTSVKDIMCRLERASVLTKYIPSEGDDGAAHKFVINLNNGVPLWRLIEGLTAAMSRHGNMMVYSDHPMEFEVIKDGHTDYMLVEGR